MKYKILILTILVMLVPMLVYAPVPDRQVTGKLGVIKSTRSGHSVELTVSYGPGIVVWDRYYGIDDDEYEDLLELEGKNVRLSAWRDANGNWWFISCVPVNNITTLPTIIP